MAASWLFLVEPAGPACCQVISRYRCDTSGDLLTRLQFGPAIIEPVGFDAYQPAGGNRGRGSHDP
jgi:hypothetical protein